MSKIAWKIMKGLIQYRDFRHLDILMPPKSNIAMIHSGKSGKIGESNQASGVMRFTRSTTYEKALFC